MHGKTLVCSLGFAIACSVAIAEGCVGDEPATTAGGDDDGGGSDVASNDSGGANDSGSGDSGAPTDAGKDAALAPPPSCVGLGATCGTGTLRDCCESLPVAGGSFFRAFDAIDGGDWPLKNNPADLSPFHLDTFEVTVARFRKFLDSYPGNLPVGGAGKNPNDATDPGWVAAWNTSVMPASKAAVVASMAVGISCSNDFDRTYTDTAGGNEYKPINCITWYLAEAFCIWDGGRLPTDAELNFAQHGGGLQRAYPWSVPPTSVTIDPTYARYGVLRDAGPAVVGSYTIGAGAFGQFDLAGNVEEFTADRGTPEYPTPCLDCALHDDGGIGANIWLRGGYYDNGNILILRSGNSEGNNDGVVSHQYGMRCAR